MSEEVIESPGTSSGLYNALDRLNITDSGRETFETAAPDVLARRKIVHRRPRPGDPPKEQHKPRHPPPPPKQTYSRGSSGSTEAVNGGRGAALIPYHSDSDSDDSITSPEVISAPSKPKNADKSPTKATILETVKDKDVIEDEEEEEEEEEKEDSPVLENGKAKTKTTTRATASHKGKARGITTVTKGKAAFEATGETT